MITRQNIQDSIDFAKICVVKNERKIREEELTIPGREMLQELNRLHQKNIATWENQIVELDNA